MTTRRGNGDSAQRITSGPSRLRMLLALLAVAAAAAVLAACSSSGTSSTGGSSSTPTSTSSPAAATAGSLKTATIGGATVLTNANGLHAVLVRPRHAHQVQLQRDVRAELAAGQGAGHRIRGHGHVRHHQAIRRLGPGHLRRAPAVHLRRRHRPRAGQGQRPERSRRAVARNHHLRHRPRRQLLIGLRRRRPDTDRTGPGPRGGLTDDSSGTA